MNENNAGLRIVSALVLIAAIAGIAFFAFRAGVAQGSPMTIEAPSVAVDRKSALKLRAARITTERAINESDIVAVRPIEDLSAADNLQSLATKITRGAGYFDDRTRFSDFAASGNDGAARCIGAPFVFKLQRVP